MSDCFDADAGPPLNYCPACEGEGYLTSPPIDITDPDYRSECETCEGERVVPTDRPAVKPGLSVPLQYPPLDVADIPF